MILKKLEGGIVIAAVEIISFEIHIEDGKTTINAVLHNAANTEVTYHQEVGDKNIYPIVDNHNDILKIIHQ